MSGHITNAELQELIASVNSGKGEIEVARISHPQINTIYITGVLPEGAIVTDENGVNRTVHYVPMAVTEESTDGGLTSTRTITITAINDIIAKEEDKIDGTVEDDIVVEFFTYIMASGALSNVVRGPLRFSLPRTIRSEKHNSVNLVATTSPTNSDETGIIASKRLFHGMVGFE